MKREYVFLSLVGGVFALLALVFLFFPRPTFSEVERRELTTFPEFTVERLANGSFANDVSLWFSDSQPYRDEFMTFSMMLKKKMAFSLPGGDDEAVTFVATSANPADDSGAPDDEEAEMQAEPAEMLAENTEIADYDGHATPEGAAKLADSGVIVVGSGPEARALMAFGGSSTGGTAYADMVNTYQKTLGPGVRVYCMVIPTAAEFYTPAKARKLTNPQLPVIRNIHNHLTGGATGVDAYTALAQHAEEPIYLRTDHHWAPLGAYYAAQAFAKAAGVDFRELSSYTPRTVKNYVGTMYGYSKDIAIKNAPEDFVYYEPIDNDYSVTVSTIRLDKSFRPVGETKPVKGRFFYRYGDGSPSAYLTFMGGDYNQTVVKTPVKNGRRLVVIKDSYGNAVPGYLFYSFEEIHVLDHRYFRHDVKSYVAENKITDVCMINNIFNAYSPRVAKRFLKILTHADASDPVKPAPEAPKAVADTVKANKKPAAPENESPSADEVKIEDSPVEQPAEKPEELPDSI